MDDSLWLALLIGAVTLGGWGVVKFGKALGRAVDETTPTRAAPVAAPSRAASPASPSIPEPVKVLTIDVSGVEVMDLSRLDSTRTRVKGVAYYVTYGERARYGGRTYLLVREPENQADSKAVAVYGKGRKVGHLSASKAAAFTPLLSKLDADAFKVAGVGTTENSSVLWVDVPKLDGLRKHVRNLNG